MNRLRLVAIVFMCCMQPDDSVLVVGMADGLLSIQYRKDEEAEAAAAKEVITKKKFSRRPAYLASVKPKQPNVVG